MKNIKGLTLVEIMVASLIFSIILGVLLITLAVGQRAWFIGDVSTELREQMASLVMDIDRELSKTRPSKTNLTLNTPVTSVRFSIPQAVGNSTVDVNGNIYWSGNITYLLNGTNLTRNFAGVNSILGINITNITFNRIQDRVVQINITAQKMSKQRQLIQDREQAIIKMRN